MESSRALFGKLFELCRYFKIAAFWVSKQVPNANMLL